VAEVCAPSDDATLSQMARDFIAAARDRHGVELRLLDDDAVQPERVEQCPLVIFGGSHQNRLALNLALRHQTLTMDASIPGEGGWAVTTHAGLSDAGWTVAQVCADAATRQAASDCLLSAIGDDAGRLVIRKTHRIEPGAFMKAHFPSWEEFTAGMPGQIPALVGLRSVALSEVRKAPADISALADLLAKGLDSGGREKNIYNAAPIDIAVTCARYYLASADPRALSLFREMLFRLADYYLKTPGGASYPSDLDFRLGALVLCFSRLEHEPLFSDDDRLLLSNLLLSCSRSIYEYAAKMWAVDVSAPTRHNHQTFPALNLEYAARYFGRFGVAGVDKWRAYSASVFSGPLLRRFKQRENANGYETFVYEHGLSWALFTGRGPGFFPAEIVRKVVERKIAATDNLFRAVDYGDAHNAMTPTDSFLARLAALDDACPPLRWYASEGFARGPQFIFGPIHGFPGIRLARCPAPAASGGWELAPLDPQFREERAPGFPDAFAFDKLAFRTGWRSDDHYLLLEAVNANKGTSHAHYESNGIVRLNHLERHWVVSNGYGRRVGVTDVTKSFSTRELGPVDHNVLVLQRNGEISRFMPPFSALLQSGRRGGLLYATTALLGYSGANWFRTVFIVAGRYALVLDRVEVVEPGLEQGHIEWNCLGDATPRPGGCRLDQKGVFMDVASPSGWRCELRTGDQSASWKTVLEEGAYPFASFPLVKIVYSVPSVECGQTHNLATLLAATRSTSAYAIAQPESGRLVVQGPHDVSHDRSVDDQDLTARVFADRCEFCFAPVPTVPQTLRNWAASWRGQNNE